MDWIINRFRRRCSGCSESGTPITRVPFTITSPGRYCLSKHIKTTMVTGKAITIESDNVVLDMNGFTLEGVLDENTEAIGIYALHRNNLTIKNGSISGFNTAIFLDAESSDLPIIPCDNNIIEQIRAVGNLNYGIRTAGDGNIVRNNVIQEFSHTGIHMEGQHIEQEGMVSGVISGNIISRGGRQGSGVTLTYCHGVLIKNNHISRVKVCITLVGQRTEHVLISDNQFIYARVGIDVVMGHGPCKYTNTLTTGVGTLFQGSGGIPVGIND